jgi:hypothetical protein
VKRRDLLPNPKERVIIGGKKKRVIHPPISKEREQLEGKKNIISVGMVTNSSQNRQLKMLNLIAQKWQVYKIVHNNSPICDEPPQLQVGLGQ